jgi:hypothetical protein
MRSLVLPLISILFISLLLSGALGLESMSDCATKAQTSQKLECYHLAAVTLAHVGNLQEAQSVCVQIVSDFDTDAYSQDIRQRADLEANNCFFDVATILGNPATCYFIVDRNNFGSKLSGATTTQDMCIQESSKAAALNPQNYFQAHPDSLCHALVILPLVLLGAIFAGRRR